MKKWATLFILALLSTSVFAADSLKVRHKSLVLGFNAAAYKGSLSSSYTRWTPAYQIGLRFEKKRIVNGLLSIWFGKVIGEDRTYKVPSGTSEGIVPVNRFETSFVGLQYEAQILLFHYKSFKFYASQGIGLLRFTPKDWDGNSLSNRDRTRKPGESYNSTSVMLPTQFGMMYNFNDKIAIGFQAGWMNTLTNYLDNMAQLSNSGRGDNIATYKMQVLIPVLR